MDKPVAEWIEKAKEAIRIMKELRIKLRSELGLGKSVSHGLF